MTTQLRFFSYVYEPNVHLVISESITIFYHLLKHSHDDTNPCFKTEVLTKEIRFYYQSLDCPPSDVHNYVGTLKNF